MSSVNLGVLISGGGTNLQALIDNIENGRIDGRIRLVISNKKDAFGLERAKKHGIKHIYLNPKDFASDLDYNLKLIEVLQLEEVELVVLAGYLKVLSKEFIQAFKNKIINIHPSLIPSFCGKGYYGENVHRAVLEYGVKITGATVHFVDEGTDTGPIIMQDFVRVDNKDSVKSLQEKVLVKEHELLVKSIEKFCQGKIHIDGRKVRID